MTIFLWTSEKRWPSKGYRIFENFLAEMKTADQKDQVQDCIMDQVLKFEGGRFYYDFSWSSSQTGLASGYIGINEQTDH